MTKLYLKIMVISCALLLCAPFALAAKRIDSVNNSSLQPLPQNVQADISRNINSKNSGGTTPQQNAAQEPTPPPITQTSNAGFNPPSFNFLLPAAIFAIALAGFIWFLRRGKT